MLQVVSMVFKHIVMLVLYLPPRPPALRQQSCIIVSYGLIRLSNTLSWRAGGLEWLGH
jgi:hypothetical protein